MKNLKELKTQYESLGLEIKKLEEEERESVLWAPRPGKNYYTVNEYCEVSLKGNYINSITEKSLKCGLVFEFNKEAEKQALIATVNNLLHAFARKSNKGRHIIDDTLFEVVIFNGELSAKAIMLEYQFGNAQFHREEDAERAIKSIGEDLIIKAFSSDR